MIKLEFFFYLFENRLTREKQHYATDKALGEDAHKIRKRKDIKTVKSFAYKQKPPARYNP